MPNPPESTTVPWRRSSAVASYAGFSSHLQVSGERCRFVIDATIEHPSQVSQLQLFIEGMSRILALANCRHPSSETDEPQFPDEGVST